MRIPSVVLDTNILVSAHICLLGHEYRVYDSALHTQLRLFVSAPILQDTKPYCAVPSSDFRGKELLNPWSASGKTAL